MNINTLITKAKANLAARRANQIKLQQERRLFISGLESFNDSKTFFSQNRSSARSKSHRMTTDKTSFFS